MTRLVLQGHHHHPDAGRDGHAGKVPAAADPRLRVHQVGEAAVHTGRESQVHPALK